MNKKGYEQLASVLKDAYKQAAEGKGAERHAMALPFHEQRMQTISQLLGSDAGMAFQAIKKLTEGLSLPHDARERELLGAINYIAGIVIFHRNKVASTMPADFGQKNMLESFDEARADIIGQNGNEGEHYNGDSEPCLACKALPGSPCGFGADCHQKKGSPFKILADSLDKPARQEESARVELPPTDHLVDPTGKPKWKDAPVWAMYLTQDAEGVWIFWQHKPSIIGGKWAKISGIFAYANSGEVAGNWRESLEEAPGHFVSGGKA